MSNTFACLILFAAFGLCIGLHHASAQTIERIRLRDSHLCCAQIHVVLQQMDNVIQTAGSGLPLLAAPRLAAMIQNPQMAIVAMADVLR